MVLAAGAGTAAIGTASLHALGASFCAGEVWKSQGVFRDIGLQVVSTKASVCKCFRITCVCNSGPRLDLFTDDGAGRQLLLAPCSPRGQRDTIGIDIVVGTGSGGQQGDCCQGGRLEREHGLEILFFPEMQITTYKKY
ncbi:hypothetical protein C7G92_19140 [Acinetobacter baumannii]|nr:hypothetical protein C7G92_19140 [Acinetobacter baumannii]